jgi:hypothetical protein
MRRGRDDTIQNAQRIGVPSIVRKGYTRQLAWVSRVVRAALRSSDALCTRFDKPWEAQWRHKHREWHGMCSTMRTSALHGKRLLSIHGQKLTIMLAHTSFWVYT